jgi:hypothetical protein
MRVLIQDRSTNHYLTQAFDWSHHARDGVAFTDSTRALDHCIKYRMRNVQIVLKFEKSTLDVFLPFDPAGH